MQKKILAMAVAGAFAAAPAFASADDSVTLYGQMKYEVGAVDGASEDDGGTGNRDLVHSAAGSRIGVRGSEDLGGGLTGMFRIQGNFAPSRLDLAATGHSWNEEVWVGVDGNFGQVRLGQSDTAMKNAMKSFRAFTDTLADGSTRPGTFGVSAAQVDGASGANSWARTTGIHYQSPDFQGFTFGATLEPTGRKTDTYYALNGMYEMGPMEFSLAYEAQSGADPSDDDNYGILAQNSSAVDGDSESYHAGFSFDFGQGDVGVKYHQWDWDSDSGRAPEGKVHQWLVPANFAVTDQINLRAAVQYNRNNPDEGSTESWTNVAVGAQYHFSNRTEAFVNIWNDGEVGTSPTNSGGVSDDGTHVGVGLRHSF
ncbi:porin [Thioalkalivibrio sp. ALE23]|uniref:porin n=1 Tax=Thioalkalivibrio sp. ALE23 TaxID=1265495 RepID=UPI000366E607|nr:porin [Thioalkalivibrio sp. ALE23]